MRVSKKSLSILLASLLLLTAVPVTTLAAVPMEIMPCWVNTYSVSPTLSISSGTATCSVKVVGDPGTTKITATLYLQRKNSDGTFSTIKTWSGLSSNSLLLTFSDTYTVSTGTYRLQCDAVVTKDGIDESVTVYGAEKTA